MPRKLYRENLLVSRKHGVASCKWRFSGGLFSAVFGAFRETCSILSIMGRINEFVGRILEGACPLSKRSNRSSSSNWVWTRPKSTPTASFVDDLGADSLDIVELVMAFEEAFDLEVFPTRTPRRSSPSRNAIDYIESKKK